MLTICVRTQNVIQLVQAQQVTDVGFLQAEPLHPVSPLLQLQDLLPDSMVPAAGLGAQSNASQSRRRWTLGIRTVSHGYSMPGRYSMYVQVSWHAESIFAFERIVSVNIAISN